MAEKKTNWTEDQLKAIETVDRNVMVTASAGTGKTAVLSTRCSKLVSTAEESTDISSMLVLTFTEAAADEMKARIADNLRRAYLETRDPKIKMQFLLIDSAQISTIHSFCKNLISDNFQLAGVDPSFSIIDTDEQTLIKSEILEQVIEQAWSDEQLSQNLRQLFYRRDAMKGARFLKKIIEVNEFLDSLPDREKWSDRLKKFCDINQPLSEPVLQLQIKLIRQRLVIAIEKVSYAISLDAELTESHWCEQLSNKLAEPMQTCLNFLEKGKYDLFKKAYNSFAWKKFKNRPKEVSVELRDTVLSWAKQGLDEFKDLAKLAFLDPEYQQAVGCMANEQSLTLLELVKRFNICYSQRKQQLNCLDFSDLEHFALRLLETEEGSPSEISLELKNKYQFVFADEYQDINEVQQRILDLVSREDNVFGVGDVKQSIYAWRQAQPDIFISKIENAKSEPAEREAMRVDLRKNFRSRKEVLDFVNVVFKRIMSKHIADIDYDDSARLDAGFNYLQSSDKCVELHIVDDKADVDKNGQVDDVPQDLYNSTTKVQRQAMLVGKRIKELIEIEKLEIYDKSIDSYRKATYSDVVILMRSVSNRINDYIEIFRILDIPVSTTSNTGYFDTTEICDCLCLLKVIDNPMQDIELVAVMRSPWFGFDETELAGVRKFTDTSEHKFDYYGCVKFYIDNGDDKNLRAKLSDFIDTLEYWRNAAESKSLADVIWHILRYNNYISFVSALPNGKQRRENLLKLHERAIQFEDFVTSNQNVSLGRFISFVEKLLEHGQDWSPAQNIAAAHDGAEIMSVHKSKGLEFPIVVLAGLGSSFNMASIKDDCLLDSDLTFGFKVINPTTKIKSESALYQVIKGEKKRVSVAEEMRILYVALTRAREKLLLVGNMEEKKCKSILTQATNSSYERLPAWMLAKCGNHMEWILNGLADQKVLCDLFDIESNSLLVDDGLFRAEIYRPDQLKAISEDILNLKGKKESATSETMNVDFKAVADNLSFRYLYDSATKLKSKTSASKIGGGNLPKVEFNDSNISTNFESLTKAINDFDARADKYTKAQIGTATHIIIQHLDLKKDIDAESISRTIDTLTENGLVAKGIQTQINIDAIEKFFTSELGRLALLPDNDVFREWQFTYAMDSAGFDKDFKDDFVIVQGMIDMLIQCSDGLVVIDFKTDNVAGSDLSSRVAYYADQINLYSNAASEIFKLPVKGKWLYFLTSNKAIEIN